MGLDFTKKQVNYDINQRVEDKFGTLWNLMKRAIGGYLFRHTSVTTCNFDTLLALKHLYILVVDKVTINELNQGIESILDVAR